MKIQIDFPKLFVVGFFGIGAALAISSWLPEASDTALATVTKPQLSGAAAQGEKLFEANCAQCHGRNAVGTDKGPPLIHDYYNPGHHPDEAFYFAVSHGVRQHHWRFGNMPPQPQVSTDDAAKIIRYVREMQVANGITYKQHQM